MAVRIRKDGRIFCAALRNAEDGDTYIDDDLHYRLSEKRVLVAEDWEKHKITAEWWWIGNVPKDIKLSDYYLNK